MSSLNRILKGSFAGFSNNLITIIINIFSLPIYLSFWKLEIYSIWILALTVTIFIKLPLFSYQEYLGYEFLKLGNKNKIMISKILFGSIFIIILYNLIIFILLYLILYNSNIAEYLSINPILIQDFKISILMLFLAETFGLVGGLLTRALFPFHYYSKLNFIGIIFTLGIPITQIIFLGLGYDITGLAIVTFLTKNLFDAIYIIYLIKWIKKEKIKFYKLDISKNFVHLKKSLFIILSNVSNLLKNEGTRIIIAPFFGTIQMAGFVVIRTASNLLKSFFNAITGSLLIEFTDFINNKDKKRFYYSYTSLYLIILFIISPISFFFQLIAPRLFDIWTKGQINFDSVLFASLTISFLIMIFYTPAMLVIKGKNLFKQNFYTSLITSSFYLLTLFIFIKIFLLRGVGYSLIFIEINTAIFIYYYANIWLKKEFIIFNKKILNITLFDLVITCVLIFLLPYNLNYTSLITLVIIFIFYKSLLIFLLYKMLSSNEKKNIKIIKKFFSKKI